MKTAMWQTLVCGMMRGEHRAVAADELHYDAFIECLNDAYKSKQPTLFRGIGGRKVDPEPSTKQRSDEELEDVLENLALDFDLGSLRTGQNRKTGNASGSAITPKDAAGASSSTPSRDTPPTDTDNGKGKTEEKPSPFRKSLLKLPARRALTKSPPNSTSALPSQAKTPRPPPNQRQQQSHLHPPPPHPQPN